MMDLRGCREDVLPEFIDFDHWRIGAWAWDFSLDHNGVGL